MKKRTILLTGATGYIGRRLKQELLKDETVSLKLLVRNKETMDHQIQQKAQIIEGSTFDLEALEVAMQGVQVAYYLIHSLADKNYQELDKQSARNFRDAAINAGVKKIIYLGGLGVVDENISKHLLSRIETGEILSEYPQKIDVIWFRAGVIIGSGSASFEIIRNLIQKIPILITPKWVHVKAQPIGVDDIITYLKTAKEEKINGTHIVDIGSQILSYGQMMLQCAEVMELKRFIIPVPFLTIGLSSYWLNLFTPVPFRVARSLIEGLRSEVVIQNQNAAKLFGDIKPVSFKEAVKKALFEAEQNQVISRWSDSGEDVWSIDHKGSIAEAVYIDEQIIDIDANSAEKVFQSFCSIGGENGWFRYDWLWEIRGLLDKLFGGAGLNRGRRSKTVLRKGDSLDFWKVVDVVPNKRLLLFAQMKVPGKAWLEFVIDKDRLIQRAYFLPQGVLGRLYWFSLLPLHYFVFRDMIDSVYEKSKEL
jgi:uncharacterized protein YbjT (DUF2867 family)